jgi:hypothetical protein
MEEATVDYYVIRIYRKEQDIDPKGSMLVGLVETRAGEQRAFHNIEELWNLLVEKK